jgi:hypothetical protein
MAKFAKFQQKSPAKRGLHPIWRGIGCILIVVVPLVAYWLTVLSVPSIIATGKVPYALLGRIQFANWTYHTPFIGTIASYIYSINNLWLNIITFFVMVMLLTGVASLLYTMFYSLVGPARYNELDAPPTKHKAKRYTR